MKIVLSASEKQELELWKELLIELITMLAKVAFWGTACLGWVWLVANVVHRLAVGTWI